MLANLVQLVREVRLYAGGAGQRIGPKLANVVRLHHDVLVAGYTLNVSERGGST